MAAAQRDFSLHMRKVMAAAVVTPAAVEIPEAEEATRAEAEIPVAAVVTLVAAEIPAEAATAAAVVTPAAEAMRVVAEIPAEATAVDALDVYRCAPSTAFPSVLQERPVSTRTASRSSVRPVLTEPIQIA